MATKQKKPTKPSTAPAEIDEATKKKRAQTRARTNLSSALNAAAIVETYSTAVFGEHQGKVQELYEELTASITEVSDGDMRTCEAMLLGQATALQSIFTNLTRRANSQEYLKNLDTYLRLGLRAQAQSVRTIEALAEIKNPRSVAFVKQANIANNQQVNNGCASRAHSFENQPSKLSGEVYELRKNAGTQSLAGGDDPTLEAMGEEHRADLIRRQSEGVPEQLQGRR